jgi:hypothetical protein
MYASRSKKREIKNCDNTCTTSIANWTTKANYYRQKGLEKEKKVESQEEATNGNSFAKRGSKKLPLWL